MFNQAGQMKQTTQMNQQVVCLWYLVAITFAATLLYGGWWTYAAATVKSDLAVWVARQRSHGWDVTIPEPAISGFPFGIVITVGPMSVTAPANSGDWTWRGPSLKVVVHPFDCNQATFHAPGVHTIRLSRHGIFVTLSVGTLTVTVNHTTHGQPQRYAVHLSKARIEGFTAPIDVQFLQGMVKWSNNGQAIVAVFNGAGIDLPPALDLPIGSRVEAVGLKSQVIGAVPPGDLAQVLAKWREAGGTVEVESLTVDWPPLKLHGSGTLALDEQLQPIGAMTARIQGFFAAVDSLSQRGVIRLQDASMAKLVLGMLAQPPLEGDLPVIDLPLTIQERMLQAGPIRLIHMPDIRWSAPPAP